MIVSISFLIGSTIYSNRRAKAQAA
jgi:hypothetical protein